MPVDQGLRPGTHTNTEQKIGWDHPGETAEITHKIAAQLAAIAPIQNGSTPPRSHAPIRWAPAPPAYTGAMVCPYPQT